MKQTTHHTKAKNNTSPHSSKTTHLSTSSIVSLLVECFIALGFLAGLVPFVYFFTLWFVIPLSLLQVFITLVFLRKNSLLSVANVCLAVLGIIPMLGFFFRICGFIVSVVAIRRIYMR
jgi:hypothetical protein